MDTICLHKLHVCGSSGGQTVGLIELSENVSIFGVARPQDSLTVDLKRSTVFTFFQQFGVFILMCS